MDRIRIRAGDVEGYGMKWLALLGFVVLGAIALNPRPFADSQRVMTWDAAVKTYLHNPILGVGPDNFQASFEKYKPKAYGHETAANAHNDILQVAATLGLLGLTAYLIVWFNLFGALNGPALASLTALFINAKFNPVPLEALILGAVICGSEQIRKVKIPALGSFPIIAIAIFCLAVTFRLAQADYYARQGDMLSLQKAILSNPGEQTYKTMLIRRGVWEIENAHDQAVVNFVTGLMTKYGNATVRL